MYILFITKEEFTMSRLIWDEDGHKLYETGVRMGVLYPQNSDGSYGHGVAWDGLTAVNESPSGGEITTLYANDNEYLQLLSKETYACTIEAYTCPDEFKECDGSKQIATGIYIGQQNRKPFGFVFRTAIGNDTEGIDHGYEITIVYGCRAQPSSRNHSTINESPEAATLSWEARATPVELPSTEYGTNLNRSATIKVRSTDFTGTEQKAKLKAFEDFIYGTDDSTEGDTPVQGTEAQFPTPKQVYDLLTTGSTSNG